MNKRSKLILVIVLVPIACIVLGLIIWACVHHLSKSTTYMIFEPKPSDDSRLIFYNSANSDSANDYINRLNEVLEPYINPGKNGTTNYLMECVPGMPPSPGSNNVCLFKVQHLYPCVREQQYGYSGHRAPCIFLKFNKFSDWVPHYYSAVDLPAAMPDYLKNYIKETTAKYGSDSPRLKAVWVSCEGVYPPDLEFIGPINYLPRYGFDGAFFPAVNEEKYLNPLVAVLFEKVQLGVVINVECKAWAKNLNHEKEEGVVKFELLVD